MSIPVKPALLLLALVVMGCRGEAKPFMDGDLVFVVTNAGGDAMENAIADATGSDGRSVTHVGILEVSNDTLWVIDATPRLGVARRSMDEFMASSGAGVTFEYRRVAEATPEQREACVALAKTFLGTEYDHTFMTGSDRIYCSELVQLCWLKDGEPVFASAPMNFKGDDGEYDPYWVELYSEMEMGIPQGEPGTNPHDMMISPRVCGL